MNKQMAPQDLLWLGCLIREMICCNTVLRIRFCANSSHTLIYLSSMHLAANQCREICFWLAEFAKLFRFGQKTEPKDPSLNIRSGFRIVLAEIWNFSLKIQILANISGILSFGEMREREGERGHLLSFFLFPLFVSPECYVYRNQGKESFTGRNAPFAPSNNSSFVLGMCDISLGLSY